MGPHRTSEPAYSADPCSVGVGAFSPDSVLSNASTLAKLVPDPSLALLLVCALVGLGVRRRLH